MVAEATCGAPLAASDDSIFTPVDAARPRQSWEHLFLHFSGNLICCAVGGREAGVWGRCFCLWEVAVTHWQVDQSLALRPVSKASSGENGQRPKGWEQPVSAFFRSMERGGIQNVTLMREPALPTGSQLSWAYLPHLDCLCLQVWLIPRITAAGENLFSRRHLINACSL